MGLRFVRQHFLDYPIAFNTCSLLQIHYIDVNEQSYGEALLKARAMKSIQAL